MATYFWVGGTGTWDSSTTTHWASSSGGAGGAGVPAAGDTVILDSNSGTGTITFASTATCGSLLCDGSGAGASGSYAGTLAFGANVTFSGTAGNLYFATGMTVSGNASIILVQAGTVNLKTYGKTLPGLNVGGTGVTCVFQDATTINNMALFGGTLNTNGQTCSFTTFSDQGSTQAHTLTMGASVITITGTNQTVWTMVSTNLTITANTATITGTGTTQTWVTTSMSGTTIIFNGQGATTWNPSSGTIAGFTYASSTAQTGNTLLISNPVTTTGNIVFTGAAAPNVPIVQSSTLGTAHTITCNGTVTLTGRMDFQDIVGAGTAQWNLSDNYDGLVQSYAPTGWWKLADGVGSPTAADSSGNGYTATNGGTGTVTFGQIGPITGIPADNAAAFSLSSANTALASTTECDQTTSSFTFGCWLQGTTPGVYFPLQKGATASAAGFNIETTSTSALLSISDGTHKDQPGKTANVFDGTWHFLVGVIDRTAELATFYLDGVAGAHDSLSAYGSITNASVLTFGSLPGNLAQAFVIPTALTATQIANLYNSAPAALKNLAQGGGDCQGNSGITLAAPQTNYYQAAASANWSVATNWFLTTNGAGGAGRVPYPQDTAIFDTNSGVHTYTADTPRFGTLTCTGFGGTLTISTPLTCFGSWTGNSNIVSGGGQAVTFGNRSASTITMGGGSYFHAISVFAPGGTYTQQDDISLVTNSLFTLQNGTWTMNGHNFTAGSVHITGGTLNMGTSTFTVQWSGAAWTYSSGTVSAGTSTIALTDTTSSAKTFAGGGQTYGTLQLANNNPGGVTISGSNTFAVPFTGGAGSPLIITSGTTQTFTSAGNITGTQNGYLALPGVSGNYASTPDAAQLDITGDIDLRVEVALTSWANGAYQPLLLKHNNFFAYDITINATGHIFALIGSGTGSTNVTATSTAAVPFTAGQTGWVRWTRVAATGVVTFYTSTDGSTWTMLGTTVSTTAGSIPVTTDVLSISPAGGNGYYAAWAVGNFYRAQVYNGIAGTLVFDANFTTKAVGRNTFVESSTYGATVTINGQAAQAGDGRVLIASSTPGSAATFSCASGFVMGTNVSVQDNTATGGAEFGVVAVNSSLVSNDTGWGLVTLLASNINSVTTETDNPNLIQDTASTITSVTSSTMNSNLSLPIASAISSVTSLSMADQLLNKCATSILSVTSLISIADFITDYASILTTSNSSLQEDPFITDYTAMDIESFSSVASEAGRLMEMEFLSSASSSVEQATPLLYTPSLPFVFQGGTVNKQREDWALQQARRFTSDALMWYGEHCAVRLKWRPEDLDAGFCERCLTCNDSPNAESPDYQSVLSRMANVYKQPGDWYCPTCQGTGFTGINQLGGGFKPIIYYTYMIAEDTPENRKRQSTMRFWQENPQITMYPVPSIKDGDLVIRIQQWSEDNKTPLLAMERFEAQAVHPQTLRTGPDNSITVEQQNFNGDWPILIGQKTTLKNLPLNLTPHYTVAFTPENGEEVVDVQLNPSYIPHL